MTYLLMAPITLEKLLADKSVSSENAVTKTAFSVLCIEQELWTSGNIVNELLNPKP